MTLDTFVTKREGLTRDQNESLRNALNHAREFADTWTGMLTFTGLHGSGKTHLAAAIGHKAASLSGAVRFFTVSDFLDQLRATFQPGRLSYSKIFEDAKRAGVLILDDLGAQKESDWATEKLRQIIDYRWLNQLPTVVTTLDTIDMDAGIRDRLFDRRIGQVVSLEGIPSFRMSEEASRMVDARSKKGKPGKHKL